ncbi:MAG: hypothetical protein R3F55_12475 [Alphaproteobacteria bacterium]
MDPIETSHRYDRKELYRDYGRSAAGLVLTLGPLAVTGASGAAAIVLGGLAGVFALFGLRTGVRQKTAVQVGPGAISTQGLRRVTVRWDEVRRVKLSYFSTRRDRQRGWMQLMLRGDGGAIRLDSQLEDFEAVVAQAAAAVVRHGIAVSDTTAANFAAYGHVLSRGDPPGAGR